MLDIYRITTEGGTKRTDEGPEELLPETVHDTSLFEKECHLGRSDFLGEDETKIYVNREHKDTVFRMLFGSRRNLLELYNGLNGTDYQKEEDLIVYTLGNAVYMGLKNDVSFILMSELNLYEHQASYNPNMPLRDLLYIARQLEKYVQGKSLYSRGLVRIPTPRFVVFYNGKEEQPERKILKLSDSFEKILEEPELELKVLMLNINYGKNRKLMERCRTLKEYSQYVACVREHAKTEPIGEAVDHAVTECIRNGVLKQFLQEQRAEVVAMSIFEYDEEEEKRKLREAEYAYGKEEGTRQGRKEGEDVLSHLLAVLLEKGDMESVRRAVESREARAELYKKYGLL